MSCFAVERRRRPLRVAASAPERRAPERADGAEAAEAAAHRGLLADARPLLATRATSACRTSSTRGELGLDVERIADELRRRTHARRVARTSRAPTRAVSRHADLLHQRPPPLRHLRHRHAHGLGARRAQPRSARAEGLGAARARPDVDAAVHGVAVDLRELLHGEVKVLDRRDVLLELLDAARPDQR